MIDREHKLSVVRQAKLLGFSRGSVYYLPRPVSDGDLALMRRIDELHLDYPFAGSRMLQGLLRGEGLETGRRHVATLMKKMGIKAISPPPEHLETSARAHTKAGSHPAQSGVGNGPDLHPHGAGICLSVRRRGLVQPEGLVMAVVDHDGSSLLHRGGGGGTCPSWQAGNLQYRPGIAVHLHRLHRRAEEVTDCHLDGWQGCVARQCLRRAALAFDQIRGSLPPCLQDCVRGTRWHRPISELLQHQTPTLALLQS